LKHNPPKFTRGGNPDKADQWMRDIERIFEATECPEERKLSCDVYMFTEDAEFWWKDIRQMMEGRGENVTWESFKVRFLEEYFPDSVKNAKEIEFMQLEQENLSVTNYATRFKHLAKFSTQIMTEDWRFKKFEFGLRQELKEVVVPLSIREFPALVEKAKVVENLENNGKVVKPQMVGGPSKSRPRYEDKKKPYSRTQSFSGGRSNSQFPPNVKCFRCGGPHMIRFCPHPTPNIICGKCHQYGHVTKDYHTRLEAPNLNGGQQVQQGNNNKPRAARRVFAISGAEAS